MQQETLNLGALILISISGPVTAGLLAGFVTLILNKRTTKSQQERDEAQALHDKTLEAEQRLAAIRAPLYRDLLKPWALLWAGIKTGQQDLNKALKLMQSSEYLETLFAFNTTAPDELVESYNDLMTTLFSLNEATSTDEEKKQAILKTGELLLAIRRGFGMTDTKLDAKDMLRAKIQDIDTIL
ncbi:hypothetical protein [Candidatus Palauibacter soopunensis]|uniref:hypothetical protein n=1 Tax=Candidatus Palauibacter soopunensis TaxID=3056739 RepID=UPI002388EA85|nr:hypothetical protein [Candidatus Palauibacter soopunensis]MDE2878709.1 hypothetical protein [Candidatus Palauibacter soopunensis]